MTIQSEELCKHLIINQKIDIITHICICLTHVNMDINFMALQVTDYLSINSHLVIIWIDDSCR